MSATTTAARPTRVYMKVNTPVLVGTIIGSGLTHREIAMKAKLRSAGTVSNLASGGRTTCSPHTAKAIAKALKAPIGKLFETVVS